MKILNRLFAKSNLITDLSRKTQHFLAMEYLNRKKDIIQIDKEEIKFFLEKQGFHLKNEDFEKINKDALAELGIQDKYKILNTKNCVILTK